MKVVIVGGVAGGATAAARLRRLDEKMDIVMVERGEYISFANCGLPYFIGGVIKDKRELTLQTKSSFYKRYRIDVKNNSEVTEIDTAKKRVKIVDASGESYESYDKLILSPGAKPRDIGIKKEKGIFSVRNIPDTYGIDEYIKENECKSAVVLGCGFIGLEMADNLKKRGLSVTLIDAAEKILPASDIEGTTELLNYIEKAARIDVHLGEKVTKVKKDKEGKFVVHTDKREQHTDILILAAGVVPDTDVVVKSGIKCTDRGAIIVDDYMQTSDSDVYALGDAVEIKNIVSDRRGVSPFASSANKQARIVANNICGIKETYQGTEGTNILKFEKKVLASTGISEQTAKMLGLNYEKSFTYSASNATYYPNAEMMSIKLIFDKEDGKIYGAQVFGGKGVDKRCDDIAVAIKAGMTAKDLTQIDFAYAPPFSSAKDPVNVAGLVADNIVKGQVKVWHWSDYAKLSERDDVSFLDVREAAECYSMFDKAKRISLKDLRENLNQLDKSKKIYVNCETGMRSYIACQILKANGFDAYNLSGGHRLYRALVEGECVDA